MRLDLPAELLKLARLDLSPMGMERSGTSFGAAPPVSSPEIPDSSPSPSAPAITPSGSAGNSGLNSAPATPKGGGSLSWRNMNPGNIRFGDFAKSHGGELGENGFAKFPSEDVGRRAGIALLRTKPYQSLTVSGAVSRWAPPSENDTGAYVKDLAKRTGLDPNRPMASLKPGEVEKMFTGGIQQHEGWTPGKGK